MCRSVLFYLTISFLFTTNFYSQDPPIEWEEIPLADLQMTSFPEDSNATAVILCDFGETRLDDDLGLVYKRNLRIKILNENGYDWGTHSIYIYTGRYGERLNDLEAITYSLDENGEIIETELDDDNIFEEEISDTRTKYSFTMPALKPGCVVDIHYRINSESLWNIRDWTFQREEPVLWSEYRIIYPKNISYAVVYMGYEPWAINEYKEVKQNFRGSTAFRVGENATCNYYRWAVKNAPALRDEPYITTISDYTNRVNIQLAGYAFYQIGTKQILTDWKTLANELLDNDNFGDKIDPGEVEELTSGITKGLVSSEIKMEAIYNWIKNSIVWSGERKVFADYDVDEVIEYKKGNSSEITFLLISMLRSAGLTADPVILSTRANGQIQELYPIISQFNYVLARVLIGNKEYFIDATDPLRPIDLLPTKVLNVKGLLIQEDNPVWVNLSSQKSNLDKAVVNVNLNPDGTLSSTLEESFGEYKSLSLRREIGNKDDIDVVKDLFNTESSGFTIDSVNVSEKDSIGLPLKIQTGISSSSYTQLGGDLIYFNPTMIHRLSDNPFKAKVRNFPIDYSYPRGNTIVMNIIIPDGYTLKEKYENKNISVDNYAFYKRMTVINGNIIQIMSKFEITTSKFASTYYPYLKEFYARVIAYESEMLVFGPIEKTNEVQSSEE
jgi:transglutaminase-like putative cysteine protease